jgi:hypothetical protein
MISHEAENPIVYAGVRLSPMVSKKSAPRSNLLRRLDARHHQVIEARIMDASFKWSFK